MRSVGGRLLVGGLIARVLVWWWIRTPLANAMLGGWAMFAVLLGAGLVAASHLWLTPSQERTVRIPARVDAPVVPLRPRVDATHRRGA